MLNTPDGRPAGDIDKIMLLSIWAKVIDANENKKIYALGMGKPTYPVNDDTATYAAWYWLTAALGSRIALMGLWLAKYINFFNFSKLVAAFPQAIGYGHPQGGLTARDQMAKALNQWYGESLGRVDNSC